MVVLLTAVSSLLSGCTHPLSTTIEQRLRDQLSATNRAYIEAISDAPTVKIDRAPSEVEEQLTDERRDTLDKMSGLSAYAEDKTDLGADLTAKTDIPGIGLTLRRAIHDAVANNLLIEQERLIPAIRQSLLEQSEAVFDAVFFHTTEWSKLDTPRPAGVLTFLGAAESESGTFTTGIRKLTTTGGQVTVQTSILPEYSNPSSFNAAGGFRFDSANIELAVSQPVLRNFGADVNRAQIELSENALVTSEHDLHSRLMELTQAVEESYWTLVFHRQRLLIRQRELERTKKTRDRIVARLDFDATEAEVTEANSQVESVRADVIRSQNDYRRASDALKRLMNAKELSVSGEAQLIPLDTPADVEIEFSLVDAVSSALNHRPEVHSALLQIEDATIRQRVADNQRLPLLDLAATIRYSGQGKSTGTAYKDVTSGDFIEYIFGANFEVPIGNRQAESAYTQRQLERRQSLINYQRVTQDVVIEVKNALRDVNMDYKLIAAQRSARRASADNVRTLMEQEKAGEGLTPDFSNRKLQALRRLATSELSELQALIDYNIAISEYYRTIGTLLGRNGIDFKRKALD